MQPKPDRSAIGREAARARWDATPPEKRSEMGRRGFAGVVRRLELAIPDEIADPVARKALLETAVREHMSGIGRLGGKRTSAVRLAAAELRAAEAERRAADAEQRADAAEQQITRQENGEAS